MLAMVVDTTGFSNDDKEASELCEESQLSARSSSASMEL